MCATKALLGGDGDVISDIYRERVVARGFVRAPGAGAPPTSSRAGREAGWLNGPNYTPLRVHKGRLRPPLARRGREYPPMAAKSVKLLVVVAGDGGMRRWSGSRRSRPRWRFRTLRCADESGSTAAALLLAKRRPGRSPVPHFFFLPQSPGLVVRRARNGVRTRIVHCDIDLDVGVCTLTPHNGGNSCAIATPGAPSNRKPVAALVISFFSISRSPSGWTRSGEYPRLPARPRRSCIASPHEASV